MIKKLVFSLLVIVGVINCSTSSQEYSNRRYRHRHMDNEYSCGGYCGENHHHYSNGDIPCGGHHHMRDQRY
ncbi:hypothetical protein AXF11_01795 [Leptotrichia sp. oral taxon 847]|nr:hypothetical protein AXF11_01795 [Leptotrichia sp. oral taxon 847]